MARCKTLPRRPRHGMVIAPKTDHGMKALFRCKDGYKLSGPNITECSFGRWTGETPICNEISIKVIFSPPGGATAYQLHRLINRQVANIVTEIDFNREKNGYTS
ncbi:UNVERIFIED_CONTAM: hypothetical protein NCL1_17494 [Trichonephila clavipes]